MKKLDYHMFLLFKKINEYKDGKEITSNYKNMSFYQSEDFKTITDDILNKVSQLELKIETVLEYNFNSEETLKKVEYENSIQMKNVVSGISLLEELNNEYL